MGRLDSPLAGASAAPRWAGAAQGSAARSGRIAALVFGPSALLIGIAAIAVVLTRSSRPALSLTGNGGSVSSVAFSPDGKALAGGDNYDASQPATIPAQTDVWDVGGLP
jgi:hypothetical protein